MNQPTIFPPAFATSFAKATAVKKATAGKQSRNTQRSPATSHISLNQKNRILAHIERDMTKLFIYDA